MLSFVPLGLCEINGRVWLSTSSTFLYKNYILFILRLTVCLWTGLEQHVIQTRIHPLCHQQTGYLINGMSQKVLFLLGIMLHIYGGENNFEIKVLNPEIGLPGIITIIKLLCLNPPRFCEQGGHNTDVINCPECWAFCPKKGLRKSFDIQ